MSRTKLPSTIAPGGYATTGVAVTLTAIDTVNGNYFTFTGHEVVVVQNTDVGAQTVTLHSAPNTDGRTRDITAESLAAGVVHVYGPFKDKEGWAQPDGTFHIDGSAATVLVAVIVLPAN